MYEDLITVFFFFLFFIGGGILLHNLSWQSSRVLVKIKNRVFDEKNKN